MSRENPTELHANAKCADQPAQSDQRLGYSLLAKYNCKLATLKIPAFQLISVTE